MLWREATETALMSRFILPLVDLAEVWTLRAFAALPGTAYARLLGL